ncbi:MAG: hypothetical protein KDC61_05170 [Saprospiraceae bacterium]|nr:hypothetical protein [Saprospiraceae bacterium]
MYKTQRIHHIINLPIMLDAVRIKSQFLQIKTSAMKAFYLIVPLLFIHSCRPAEDRQLDPLIGQWQENAPITYIYDSQGAIVDSVDLNSTYTFYENFTYTSLNDEITNADSGTWMIDSIYTANLYLYPDNANPSGLSAEHLWAIDSLTDTKLLVYHIYERILLNDTLFIAERREFVKIE